MDIKILIAKELIVEPKFIGETPDKKMGDYSCKIAFTKENKEEYAKNFARNIKKTGIIKNVEVQGPYINLFLNWSKINKKVIIDIQKKGKKYGSSKNKEKVLMDIFQPNLFKAVHIGHLRNGIIGESIRRILEFSGRKVNAISYPGDVGMHTAKWLWYYNKFYKGSSPKNNFSRWAGDLYTKASDKSEENEEYKKETSDVLALLEKNEKKLTEQWKKMKKLCMDDLKRVQKELGITIQGYIFESEVEKIGKEVVKELLNKKIAEISEGAVIVHLEKYNLGVIVLQKSNQSCLYSTKDLGLAELKDKKFDYNKSLIVVGNEQDMYFKQIFKIFELAKKPYVNKYKHISYALVSLPEGKMSSRKGNVILYEDTKDEIIEESKKEIIKRNPKITKKELEVLSKKISFGAMKFSMLSVDNNKQIIFDIKKMLEFEGKTGPYCQYAVVRINKILKKTKAIPKEFESSSLKLPEEIELIKKISEFESAVSKSAENYSPSMIANYAYELSRTFSSFYEKIDVLKSNKKEKSARLNLLKAVKITLENSLYLLGIEVPERM